MWFRTLFGSLDRRISPSPARRNGRNAARRQPAPRRLRLESREDRRLLCGDLAESHALPVELSQPPIEPAFVVVAAHPAAAIAHSAKSVARGDDAPLHPTARLSAARLSTAAPSLTISFVSRSEGQSGQTAFAFTVSL